MCNDDLDFIVCHCENYLISYEELPFSDYDFYTLVLQLVSEFRKKEC